MCLAQNIFLLCCTFVRMRQHIMRMWPSSKDVIDHRSFVCGTEVIKVIIYYLLTFLFLCCTFIKLKLILKLKISGVGRLVSPLAHLGKCAFKRLKNWKKFWNTNLRPWRRHSSPYPCYATARDIRIAIVFCSNLYTHGNRYIIHVQHTDRYLYSYSFGGRIRNTLKNTFPKSILNNFTIFLKIILFL